MVCRHTTRQFVLITLTLLLFAAPVFCQSGPASPPPVSSRVNTDRIRQQDMSQREWQLRNFGTDKNAPKDRRQIEALMMQTEEDFNRILALHNEIVRVISSKDELNYQFVSEATAEIKKRATRVQSSLALRLGSEDAAVKETMEPEFKDSLIKLCKEIRAFVTNPMIENPNTVDAQQLVRAKRDLESFLQLSGLIKKEADKLSRRQQ